MGKFSDGRASSTTWDAPLGQTDNSRLDWGQLNPVGLIHPRHRLWHENASGGSSQLSPGEHHRGFETLTPLKYCCLCFGIGSKCRCTNVPCQTPSQGSALWMPLTMSYATMASPTTTMASSPVGGVPPLGYPPPGPAPGDPALMDTLLTPSTGNLLATASVGRELRLPAVGPQTPTAPGPRQVQPSAIQQQMPTSGRHEAGQATPYQQQVYPPQHTSGAQTATTKASAAPSTSQGHDETARGGEDARGRSSS